MYALVRVVGMLVSLHLDGSAGKETKIVISRT